MVLMGWWIVGVNIWIGMDGRLIMIFWDVVIAGLIMGFWSIVRGVFIRLLILSIFVLDMKIVLVISTCIFYVTNLLNNIIYF